MNLRLIFSRALFLVWVRRDFLKVRVRFLLLLFGRILTQVEESWSEELRLLVLLWLLNDFNPSRALQASQYHGSPGVMKPYLVNLPVLQFLRLFPHRILRLSIVVIPFSIWSCVFSPLARLGGITSSWRRSHSPRRHSRRSSRWSPRSSHPRGGHAARWPSRWSARRSTRASC